MNPHTLLEKHCHVRAVRKRDEKNEIRFSFSLIKILDSDNSAHFYQQTFPFSEGCNYDSKHLMLVIYAALKARLHQKISRNSTKITYKEAIDF